MNASHSASRQSNVHDGAGSKTRVCITAEALTVYDESMATLERCFHDSEASLLSTFPVAW